MFRCVMISLISVVTFQGAFAQLPEKSEQAKKEVSLSSLDWLSGEWVGKEGGMLTEENWMAPRGRMMLGVNRMTSGDRVVNFEHLRIVEVDKKITYYAGPGGRKPIAFALKESTGTKVVFENPEHDFPQRIIYERDGDSLSARIEGRGQAMEMKWARPKAVAKSKAALLSSLASVVIHVNDLAEAKKWYSKVLEVKPYFDQPFYVGFKIGDHELGLDPDMKDVVKGNNAIAYWRVAECKKAFDKLVELGAKPVSEPEDVGEGTMVATVRDPFGNILGIIMTP